MPPEKSFSAIVNRDEATPEENSYEYGGIRLYYEPNSEDYKDGFTVYMTKNGVRSILFNDAIHDFSSGVFPQFSATNNPEIALFKAGTGDSCRGFLQSYYINTITGRVVKVFEDTPCSYTEIKIIDAEGKISKIRPFWSQNECGFDPKYKGKPTLFEGIALNGQLKEAFSRSIELICLGPDGIAPRTAPEIDITYEGIKKDLSKIYFSLKIHEIEDGDYAYVDEKPVFTSTFYSFDLENQVIQQGNPIDLLEEISPKEEL